MASVKVETLNNTNLVASLLLCGKRHHFWLTCVAQKRLFLSSLMRIQGLQILLMSGVTVNSASQILKSFWNIWSQLQVSTMTTKKAIFRLSNTWSWHVYTIVRGKRSSCGGPLTWKAQIHDGGHRVNFDCNLPSSYFFVQFNSLILMI